jgi:hypothetical protein
MARGDIDIRTPVPAAFALRVLAWGHSDDRRRTFSDFKRGPRDNQNEFEIVTQSR